MKIEPEIKGVLRHMLLPIPTDEEPQSIEIAIKVLQEIGLEKNAFTQYIKTRYELWKESGTVDEGLSKLITECLNVGENPIQQLIAEKYFTVHNSFSKLPFISFELSVVTLSHLRMIITLATKEQMSAAKITKAIIAVDHRLSLLSWKHIQHILSILRIAPQLNQEKSEELYQEDEAQEEELFADASIEDAAFQVGEIGKQLLFEGDLGDLLKQLSTDDSHLPYLQILHYQCFIANFYDHVFSIAYEFSPRGFIAGWVFSKWDNLVPTSNPILNNAKAVDVLDLNWARSKKPGEYEKAVLLVRLLKGLDDLGFAAAREISLWIRRWLVRYIKLNSVTIEPIPSSLLENQITTILNFVKSSPTSTFGILEQRYVDVYASFIHPKDDGWRSKGVGDSVNSNNLSKRKLGDCDFQNITDKLIVAYEAHGGILSKIYFEGHLRTLKNSLSRRKEELEGVADISEWTLNLVFVAYGFDTTLPTSANIDSLKIIINYRTFEDLYNDIDSTNPIFKEYFQKAFIDPLNDRRTPAFIREKIKSVI